MADLRSRTSQVRIQESPRKAKDIQDDDTGSAAKIILQVGITPFRMTMNT